MTAGEVVASAREVSVTYGIGALGTPVLRACSCDIYAGQLTLLTGPSGSGKTTLVSTLGGLLRPGSGSVALCGTQVSHCNEEESARVRREHLGFVFQSYRLFPALSALQNVSEVLRLKGYGADKARELSVDALRRVGLSDRLHHRPGELSGGQRQRVAIARAMAARPRLVIGDEVTAALDPHSASAVVELLADYVSEGMAVLLVTHDTRLERSAHRVLRMGDGAIESEINGGAWLGAPRAERAHA